MSNTKLLACSTLCLLLTVTYLAADDLEYQSTWQIPTEDLIAERVTAWAKVSLSIADQAKVRELWGQANELKPLPRVLLVIESVYTDLNELERCGESISRVKDTLRKIADKPSFVRDQVRLSLGIQLSQKLYFNEALEQLSRLQLEDSIDPIGLLFHQSVCEYRLLQRDASAATVQQLLENEPDVPRRYVRLARLMEAELKNLKSGSLDEIAHLMRNIKTRLGQGQAGKRVRSEEDEVIAKLDRLIAASEPPEDPPHPGPRGEDLPPGGPGGFPVPGGLPSNQPQPSNPAPDSYGGGGSSAGNIDPPGLAARGAWGNLPAAERTDVIQHIGRELPAHYREVVEEYFRKLARDGIAQR